MLRSLWAMAYLSNDGRTRHLAQQGFIVGLAGTISVVFGIFRGDDFMAPAMWIGRVLLGIATLSVVLVPWRRLPPLASALPPLVDMLAIGLMRIGLPLDGVSIAYLTFLPAVWLAISHRMRGVRLAVLGSALLVAVPGLLAQIFLARPAPPPGGQPDVALVIRYLVLPVVVGVVAIMLEGLHGRLQRAVELQHHFAMQVESESQQASHTADLLEAVGQSLPVGVVVLDRDGHDLMHNRMKDTFDSFIKGPTGDGDFVHHPDGVTRMPEESRPSVLAMAGETFDGRVIVIGEPGTAQRTISVSARPILVDGDLPDGSVLVLSDITDLRNAIRAREEFLAKASHELRTPLTSIVGYLDLVSEEVVKDQPDLGLVGEYLLTATRNGDQLMTLVQDLLLEQQSVIGVLNVVPKRARITQLVQETLDSARPLAEAKDITLSGDLDVTPVMVVDPARLRQVFDNLVSNAIKYTQPGGEVSVMVRISRGSVEISVVDNGPGLSQEDADQLFTPFFRAGGGLPGVGGVGLGLTIAKTLTEAHHGFISVDSRLGHGTTVRVTIPLSALGEQE